MKKSIVISSLVLFFLVFSMANVFAQPRFNVSITSNVRGADVYIDGRLVGKTPLTIPIFLGNHNFRVMAEGYQVAEKTIMVKSNMTFAMDLERSARPPREPEVNLRVTANVRGAKIYIDGDYIADAPASFRIRAGSHELKVTANGYLDFITTVNARNDTVINADLEEARRIHTLSVTADVRNARVFINDKVHPGFAPVNVQLERGRYTVKVVRRGFAPFETTVNLNRDTRIDARLRASNPEVSIVIPDNILNNRIKDPESRIDVYVDGRKQQGFEFSVNAGRRRLRVEIGPLVMEREMNFRDGMTYTIRIGFAVDIDEDKD